MFATPTSQIKTISEGLRVFSERVSPFTKTPRLEISVLAGLHEGAVRTVSQDVIHVGSHGGSDLILLDHGVTDHHFGISTFHSFFGPLSAVHAMGGSVKIGQDILEAGQVSRQYKLPIEIVIGDNIRLRIGREPPSRPGRSRLEQALMTLRRAILVMILASACLLASSMFWGERFILTPSDASVIAVGTSEMSQVTLTTVEHKLAEMGLDAELVASELQDGMIQISGQLKENQAPAWEQVLLWYDTMSFGRPILTAVNRSIDVPPMPPISMVRLHEPRELILASGETLTIGERLAGDWRLVAIHNDRIEIGLDEASLFIDFAEPTK